MRVNLSKMPDQQKTYALEIADVSGGLNIWELDYRIDANQSPNLKNLWWQDGVLQSRDGQTYLFGPQDGDDEWEDLGVGKTCYGSLFWGYAIFHIGDNLYCAKQDEDPFTMKLLCSLRVPLGMEATERGTFFRYNDWLFYKCKGNFIKIIYTPGAEQELEAADLTVDSYVPVLVINATPKNGSGTLYQPENRLSPKKTIRYNAWNDTNVVTRTGDGTTTEFDLGITKTSGYLAGIQMIYLGNDYQSPSAYTVDIDTGKVTFTDAPAADVAITITCLIGDAVYHLPVQEIEYVVPDEDNKKIVDVYVGGVLQREAPEDFEGDDPDNLYDYKVDRATGIVTFIHEAPPVENPPRNNTVEITYSKMNADAMKAIMDCPYAIVAGGDTNLSIILGGCDAQPNAVFWNSNDNLAMNPSYWPISYYNLVSDTEDRVTGFGMQYRDVIVFKEHSLGKLSYSVQTVDARDSISYTYIPINAKAGCDLPWSIQLIENNLVFCNTYQGVHILRSSSPAMENNVDCISQLVNSHITSVVDDHNIAGVLADVRNASVVTSFDDDKRYWLCADDKVYVWDYILSQSTSPSWFYLTDVPGIAYYFDDQHRVHHLDRGGRITRFGRYFSDYGRPINKEFQSFVMNFGTYERLKDVTKIVFAVRSETATQIDIRYDTDYESRYDLTDVFTWAYRCVPFDLSGLLGHVIGFFSQNVPRYAQSVVRKPMCRHVKHFQLFLGNNIAGEDLSIISIQVFYRFQGRER